MRDDQDVHGVADSGDVRVLVVDSLGQRRQVMVRLLEHLFEPSEIAEADSRTAALESVGRCGPDGVVVEIQMPVDVGLGVIESLDRISPRPRIVACSFRHDAATVAAALERGADAYIAKPAGTAELRAALCGPPAERAGRPRPPGERSVSPVPIPAGARS